MKKCTCCGKEFFIQHFYKNRKGLPIANCRSCHNKKCVQWSQSNRDKCRASRIKHYKKYREKEIATVKAYQKINKEKIKIKRRGYILPENTRISKNLRTAIDHAVKHQDTCKSARTLELLGCSIPELKLYLSSKFLSGMNWKNRGYRGWHIDHIVPCSAFNLKNIDQQKQCFHYTNLQPLWAKDNFSKGYKIR